MRNKGAPILALSGFLLLLASEAVVAQARKLKALGSSDVIFVWKDKESHDEAMSLINAGVHQSNPAMLYALLACMVPAGTEAVITDGGFVTQDILITSGEHSGCRGNVATEAIDTGN